MKKLISILLFVLMTFLTSSFAFKSESRDIDGRVVWVGKRCDFCVVETRTWFVLVEIYNGNLSENDFISGDLHSYGSKKILNKSQRNREVRVYIENYWGRKDTGFEWLKSHNKCEL